MIQKEPPWIGNLILKWIYDEPLYSEVSGDLREIFINNSERVGRFIASAIYIRDAFLSIRNYNLRRRKKTTQNNTIPMFKNYLKITLRTISKNRVYSFLNISGLALGIAACVFILQYVSYERSYDKFHENHESLYRVRYQVYRSGDLQIDCAAAVPRVGPFMKEKMPEVRDFARAYPASVVFTYEDKKYREDRVHVADPSFIKIFSFPLISGDQETALNEPNAVVISESAAKKYFGSDEPMGKMVRMNDNTDLFQVTGVAKDVPNNLHIKFDFLISYETLNNWTRNEDGTVPSETAWGWYDYNTYVLLEEGTDLEEFDSRFNDYLWDEQRESYEKYDYHQEFPLQPITSIHLYSKLLQESEPEEQGDGDAVFFLTIIAAFILLIAWINYINLSTARSVERAKEVGVRKTLGAFKGQLLNQFLAESFVLNFFSLLIALLIVVLGIGYFNQLTGSRLDLSFLTDPLFLLTVVGIYLLGSVLSGLYPAFVLSSFKPVAVLKGKLVSSQSGKTLRKVLVIFQFIASVSLIAGTLIVFQQLNYMKKLDLGFDMTETLVVKGPNVFGADSLYTSTMRSFKTELLRTGIVTEVSSSSNVPGDEIFWTRGAKKVEDPDDMSNTMYIIGADYDYFPTYNIELIAGRNFDRSFGTDTAAVILNKTAALLIGFESAQSAIGKKINYSGGVWTVIGVVDDYNQMSVKSTVSPLLFQVYEEGSNYFTMKLASNNYQEAFEKTQVLYDQFFPGNPYDYFFLDDFFNRQYENENKFSRVFTLFSVFAIIVACLGLFGLSSYSAVQKTKEIGIRKAMGASVQNIVLMLSREFIILLAIANVIAWPVVYLVMDSWLSNFSSRISIGLSVFLLSAILVFVIALVTVGYQTLMTAKSNPIKALRYE